jgi:hypothetical protein
VPVPAEAAPAPVCGPLGEGCETLPDGDPAWADGAVGSAPSDPATANQTERERREMERLFGGAPSGVQAPPAIPTVTLPSPDVPLWAWPLVLVGAVALYVLRDRLLRRRQPAPVLRVLGRVSLGKEGSLALVDVDDGRGGSRRLLLGLGAGTPQLLTDLSQPARRSVDTPLADGEALAPPRPPRPPGATLAVVGEEDDDEDLLPPPRRAPRATAQAWETALDEAEAEVEVEPPLRPLPIPPYTASPAPMMPPLPMSSAPMSPVSMSPSVLSPVSSTEPLGAAVTAHSPLRSRRLPPGLEQRDDLIAEVLAERGGEGEPEPRRRAGSPWARGT